MDERDINVVDACGHMSYEQFVSLENLFGAWREFRRGKRHRRDVQIFEFELEDNIFALWRELLSKTYRHGSYESFQITDPKSRKIHKATVRDRVVHQALFRILFPVFDKQFITDSYSCRKKKGTHRAVRRLQTFCNKASANNTRDVYVLKCDVRKYFDSVDHHRLMLMAKRVIKDQGVLGLMGEVLQSLDRIKCVALPLGNVTSQLFANLYLNQLDRFIKHTVRGKYYIRYCDDFVIIQNSLKAAESLIPPIKIFLEKYLALSLHPQKINIRTYRQGVDFLGYVVRPHCVTLRACTRRRMFAKCNSRNITSYLGVLSHCSGAKLRGRLIEKEICLTTLLLLGYICEVLSSKFSFDF